MAEGDGDLSLSEVLELATLFEAHRPRLLAMLRAHRSGARRPARGRRDPSGDLPHRSPSLGRSTGPFGHDALRVAVVVGSATVPIDAWRRDVPSSRSLADASSAPASLEILAATGTTPSSAALRGELQALVRRGCRAQPADREIIGATPLRRPQRREAAKVLGITENAANVRHSGAPAVPGAASPSR